MLTAVLKAVKMLLSCCPKNSQDTAVLTALKAVQDAEKNHPTKIKYKDLFPSFSLRKVQLPVYEAICLLILACHFQIKYKIWFRRGVAFS
jgi:hypothetical protein